MDAQRFDTVARLVGYGGSRRHILKLLAGGLAGGWTAATTRSPAAAQQCLESDAPCTDAGTCCASLVCLSAGPDSGFCSAACRPDGANCRLDEECCDDLPCVTVAGEPFPICGGTVCSGLGEGCASDADCCAELTCSGGTCITPASTCQEDGAFCATSDDCCTGLTCHLGGICREVGQTIENFVVELVVEQEITEVTEEVIATVTLDGAPIGELPDEDEDPAAFAARIGAESCIQILVDTAVDTSLVDTTFDQLTSVDFEQSDDAVIIGDLNDWPNIFVAQGTLTVTTTETSIETQHITETTTETYDLLCLSAEAGGAVVSIHKATCPHDTGGDIFEQCHGNALAGVGFSIGGAGVRTNSDGVASAVVAAGAVTLTEDAGTVAKFEGAYVYCSEQGSGTVLYDTRADSGFVSFTVADGNEVICDWYNLTAAKADDADDTQGETTALPATGSGTAAGRGNGTWGAMALAGSAAALVAQWLRRSPDSPVALPQQGARDERHADDRRVERMLRHLDV